MGANEPIDRNRWSELSLAEAIAELQPAPEGWVKAAQELPVARRALDELIAQAQADAGFRAEVLARPEPALLRAGQEPGPALRAVLRAGLRTAPTEQ